MHQENPVLEEGLLEGLMDNFKVNPTSPNPDSVEVVPAQPPSPDMANPEPPSNGVFDEVKYLESLGVKSKEEIIALREEVAKFKASPAPSDIDDPILYGLSRVKKERPEDFDLFMKLKLQGGVDNIDLLTRDYIKRNPAKKDNPDLVRDFIKRKYGLDAKVPEPFSPDDYTEEEVKEREVLIREAKRTIEFAEMQIEEDVSKVRNAYDQEFEGFIKNHKAFNPEKKAEMAASWEPVAKKFLSTLNKIPVYIPGPEGKPHPFMDFTIPESQIPVIEKAIVDYAVSSGLPYDETSVNKIYEFVIGQVYGANMFQINHSIAEKARSMTEEEYDKAYRNPSAISNPTRNPSAGETPYQRSYREAMRSEGIEI